MIDSSSLLTAQVLGVKNLTCPLPACSFRIFSIEAFSQALMKSSDRSFLLELHLPKAKSATRLRKATTAAPAAISAPKF